MVIHSGEVLYVDGNESISIFSDLTNFGSFASAKNSKIIFSGKRWNNLPGSLMPDESVNGVKGIGGEFTFTSLVPGAQYIYGSGNAQFGAGFPNFTIDNPENVILNGSDLAIRNNLNFQNGHLILNDRSVSMGPNNTITGYNRNRFVVTGANPQGGFLIRNTSGQNQQDIIFPVGTRTNSYTPTSLQYTGISQNLKVRVFEKVFEKGVSGPIDYTNSVKKTWHISVDKLDSKALIDVKMQHNSTDEGPEFALRRTESFVSRFEPGAGIWDISATTGSTPGILMLAEIIPNTFVSSRVAIGKLSLNEFFTISVIPKSTLASLRIPQGISPNGDGLNDRFTIQNLNSSDKIRFEVYNSWQSMVYKDLNYKNNFEGFGNQSGLVNQTLPNGTYYYIININDGKARKGFFVINR
jgi:gliding motility-associated-like protein